MLIEYLKGLKGNQRKVLLEEAETFIKEIDNIDDENEVFIQYITDNIIIIRLINFKN